MGWIRYNHYVTDKWHNGCNLLYICAKGMFVNTQFKWRQCSSIPRLYAWVEAQQWPT